MPPYPRDFDRGRRAPFPGRGRGDDGRGNGPGRGAAPGRGFYGTARGDAQGRGRDALDRGRGLGWNTQRQYVPVPVPRGSQVSGIQSARSTKEFTATPITSAANRSR